MLARSLVFIGCLVLLHTPCAFADDRKPPPDPMTGEPADGRAKRVSAGQVFLWVPRLVFMPLRYLWKGISYPLTAMGSAEEKHHLSQKLYYMFTTQDGMIGVRPELNYSLSFSPSLGASFFDNKLFGRDTYYDATLRGSLANDIVFTRMRARPTPSRWPVQLDFSTTYNRRDDMLFTGIGMNLPKPARPSRYQIDDLQITSLARFIARPELRFFLGTQYAYKKFENGRQVGNDPPIAEVFCVRDAAGRCAKPNEVSDLQVPNFNQGAQYLRVMGGFVLDARDSSFRPTSGAMIEATLDYSHGVGGGDESSYLRFRGSLTGVLDLWKRTHILVIRAWGMTVAPFGPAQVPFSELVVLGGPESLRGVRWDFLRDYSGVLFTAEYRWPIWMWMDASLFADAGGVFQPGWRGFAINNLIPDVGVALRIRSQAAFYAQIQTAWSPADGWQFFIAFTAVP